MQCTGWSLHDKICLKSKIGDTVLKSTTTKLLRGATTSEEVILCNQIWNLVSSILNRLESTVAFIVFSSYSFVYNKTSCSFSLPVFMVNTFKCITFPVRVFYVSRELVYATCLCWHTLSGDCNRPYGAVYIHCCLKYLNNVAKPALFVALVYGERRKGAGCVCGLGQGLWT